MRKPITQYEAVIETIEKLGGVATLGQLYHDVPRIPNCHWKTKTPFASIRRIVQLRPEIYKIKPGLYGLVSYRERNESAGVVQQIKGEKSSVAAQTFDHYYYQGLLLTIGNARQFGTFAPNQDKNRLFLTRKLNEVRTLQTVPAFSHAPLVKRSATIDVIWFNERQMPDSFFEVESSTDIHNSLLKFADLRDFFVRMFIVASESRRKEYDAKVSTSAFKEVKARVQFLDYESVGRQYAIAVAQTQMKSVF